MHFRHPYIMSSGLRARFLTPKTAFSIFAQNRRLYFACKKGKTGAVSLGYNLRSSAVGLTSIRCRKLAKMINAIRKVKPPAGGISGRSPPALSSEDILHGLVTEWVETAIPTVPDISERVLRNLLPCLLGQ